ncbi:hypothetical protein PR202_gb09742 [Eleusine coracana subsp. coracana]|uniref:Peptidase M48 domain-containing protein n=1 Tax=Eleusine coracana subsp. coracana TaxID=191504 RepID=A0AAV5EI00_ELECO|nr:hypothetical protein PR202_gb09742 [Eleusine coracana subsp. coracana]
MNCLKNSRSVLSRLLRTVSSTRPLPAQAPPGGYYYASRAFRDNVAPSPPPQVPNSRYFFTSPWAWGKKGTSSHGRRRRRGPRWYHDARKITSAVVLVAGASGGVGVVTIYLRNLEAVPYTNRTHFIILSHKFERFIGEVMFADLKKELGRKILPPLHPDSVRVHRIASEIVRAVDRGLDCRQRVEARAVMLGGSRRKDGGAAATAKRGDGEGLGAQPRISSLLDGWEVIVVRDKKVNAGSAPGGKIVLYTGLLDKLWDDAEIATVLGHEFGHAIARHVGERFTKDMWHLIVHIVTFSVYTQV